MEGSLKHQGWDENGEDQLGRRFEFQGGGDGDQQADHHQADGVGQPEATGANGHQGCHQDQSNGDALYGQELGHKALS